MGLVYPAIIARQGFGTTLLKVLKRAGTLYALTVLLTLTQPPQGGFVARRPMRPGALWAIQPPATTHA